MLPALTLPAGFIQGHRLARDETTRQFLSLLRAIQVFASILFSIATSKQSAAALSGTGATFFFYQAFFGMSACQTAHF